MRPGAEDEALIHDAVRGDQRAFGLLCTQYTPLIARQILRIAPDTRELEDLQQQVLMRLFRALPQFRRESSFATFLTRIAKNVTFDHLRQRYRSPALVYDEDFPEPEDERGSPLELADSHRQLRALIRRLDAHNEPRRRAAALVLLEGKSFREAAAAAGTSPATVRGLVRRARRYLSRHGDY